MFKNVLVGVDGRPNGRDAIALAALLTDSDGKLTLAHVHSGELRVSHAISPEVVRRERESSKKLLEDERAAANVNAELSASCPEPPVAVCTSRPTIRMRTCSWSAPAVTARSAARCSATTRAPR